MRCCSTPTGIRPRSSRPGTTVHFVPSVSALEIVDVGWSTTIQDAGRPGRAAIGVPPSGALDGPTRDLLNRLVGNPSDAAVLETAGRLRVRAVGPCTVALSSELAPRAVNDGEIVQVDPADDRAVGLRRRTRRLRRSRGARFA